LQNDKEPKFHKITINLAAIEKGHTLGSVQMDGVVVKGVRSIDIHASHQDVTEVTLTLIASVDAEIFGAEVLQE
jgi:hypothetical protein